MRKGHNHSCRVELVLDKYRNCKERPANIKHREMLRRTALTLETLSLPTRIRPQLILPHSRKLRIAKSQSGCTVRSVSSGIPPGTSAQEITSAHFGMLLSLLRVSIWLFRSLDIGTLSYRSAILHHSFMRKPLPDSDIQKGHSRRLALLPTSGEFITLLFQSEG